MKLKNIRNTNTGITTFGGFWKEGSLQPEAVGSVAVLNEKGAPVPVQNRITAYWPDGSVKWTAHTGLVKDLGANIEILKESEFKINPLRIAETESEEGLLLDTGFFEIYI
ncbi:MAG: hypothetical protein ILP13_02390, partial [Lachnospiraceae bacterium]|nr:hypothetical protein [Lachnospiraceae bacterium]